MDKVKSKKKIVSDSTVTTISDKSSKQTTTMGKNDIQMNLASLFSNVPMKDRMKIFLKVQGIRRKMAGRGTQEFRSFDELKAAVMDLDPMFEFLKDIDESQVLGFLSILG